MGDILLNNSLKLPCPEGFHVMDDEEREELIRKIENSVEKLTLQELEALYYDMSTKNYIND